MKNSLSYRLPEIRIVLIQKIERKRVFNHLELKRRLSISHHTRSQIVHQIDNRISCGRRKRVLIDTKCKQELIAMSEDIQQVIRVDKEPISMVKG